MYQFKPGQDDDEILQGGSEFLFFGGYFSMVAQSKASSTKAISLWKRSSGRSSAAMQMQVSEIQKVSSCDLEAKMCAYHVPNGLYGFFTKVFRDITRQ